MSKVKKVKGPKVKTWRELYDKCKAGDEFWQRVCIGALENLGNPTMPSRHDPFCKNAPKWQAAYRGLQEYISALVCEYGEGEDAAERSILEEVNFVVDCCDNVVLEWTDKDR